MIYWLVSLTTCIAAIAYFLQSFRYRGPSLRVLMYHKISADGTRDFLTVSAADLEEHFKYLREKGYTPILLSELTDHVLHNEKLPPKPVLITFDDGYRDNWQNMYPLLAKHGMKGNIFLIASFIQQDIYLHVSDCKAMDPALIEFGLHSYDHKSYKDLSAAEISCDIDKCREAFQSMGIAVQPCLAFTYGAYPKHNKAKRKEFFHALRTNHIILSFRIGNRLNPLPLKNPLLIQRLDIRGDTSFEKFKSLLAKGKRR